MRIAAISTLANGGATVAARRITQALTGAGHDCTFFVMEGGGNPFFHPLSDTAEPHFTNDFWTTSAASRWGALVLPEALKDGAELFSDAYLAVHPFLPLPSAILNAEVIHFHWMAGMLFSPALLQAIQGKKVIWTLHDMNAFTGGCHYHPICRKFETHCEECPMLRFSSPTDASFRGFELKKALYSLLAPTVVTPSAWLAGEVRCSALFEGRPTATIQNCIDLEVFKPKDRAQLRRQFGLRSDSLVVLFGADYLTNSRKNVQGLLDALNILAARKEGIPLELLAFGNDVLPEVPYPLTLLGYVGDEPALADIYSIADIYIQPSLLDNLPNTLCEAQCCGTPVLSFDVGGCSETMIPGKTGFLLQEKTALALADALEEIFFKREELEPMRQAARIFALERFAPQDVAAAYTSLFEQAFPVPELDMASSLSRNLLQNQIASLANLVHKTSEEHAHGLMESDRRLADVEGMLPQLDERLSRMESMLTQWQAMQVELAQLKENMRHLKENMRHPLCWLLRKLRNRSSDVWNRLGSGRSRMISSMGRVIISWGGSQRIIHRNLPSDSRIRVGIDCLQISPGVSGGVESYMEMLVNCLVQDGKYAAILICTDEQYTTYHQQFGDAVGYRCHAIPRIARFVSALSQLLRGKPVSLGEHVTKSFADLYEASGISILHSPMQLFSVNDFSVPSVLNLHDLQHLHLPENFQPNDIEARNELYPRAAAKATRIIATSLFIRDDIEKNGYATHEKLAVIPVTWNPEVSAGLADFDEATARKHYHLPELFAFYPAQFWPHKNHARLIEALAFVREELSDVDIRLVLTGNRSLSGWAIAESVLRKYQLEPATHCLDRVSTRHLAGLYKAARFCIVPSTFEASSYPVIEAQLLGCPVMCSDVTSLPELMAGGAGLLFNPWDSRAIADAMLRWLRYPEEAEAAAGVAHAKVRRDHSREAYTRRLVALYDSLLSRPIQTGM